MPSKARAPGEAKIAVKDVLHRYSNDVEALKNVNIDVHPGEFVCLLGPSGCGKSHPALRARRARRAQRRAHLHRRASRVQRPRPGPAADVPGAGALPVADREAEPHVRAARRAACPRAEREARAREFIGAVHLDGFEDTLPHQLSGGMRMRASLARALAMDPAVLLMDEPFGALDAQTRGQMHQLLQQIWMRDRKTVVFVTHDVREALVLGDRVVVMAARPGRVLQDLEVRLPAPARPGRRGSSSRCRARSARRCGRPRPPGSQARGRDAEAAEVGIA